MFTKEEKKLIYLMLEDLINSDERELVNPKTIESLYNKVK
tara:strand:+ start:286 stop:405 length:120 start_codon:yes stop_codon:yes gene_type:complete